MRATTLVLSPLFIPLHDITPLEAVIQLTLVLSFPSVNISSCLELCNQFHKGKSAQPVSKTFHIRYIAMGANVVWFWVPSHVSPVSWPGMGRQLLHPQFVLSVASWSSYKYNLVHSMHKVSHTVNIQRSSVEVLSCPWLAQSCYVTRWITSIFHWLLGSSPPSVFFYVTCPNLGGVCERGYYVALQWWGRVVPMAPGVDNAEET